MIHTSTVITATPTVATPTPSIRLLVSAWRTAPKPNAVS